MSKPIKKPNYDRPPCLALQDILRNQVAKFAELQEIQTKISELEVRLSA